MDLRSLLLELGQLLPPDLENPEIAIREIMLQALKLSDASQLIALPPETEIKPELETKIKQDVAKLSSGMPLAYVLGNMEFLGHKFKVTPDVLIPRPETEELVELFLEHSERSLANASQLTILEVGTGSGCIMASICFALRKANIPCTYIGIDISKPAWEITKQNIESTLKVKLTTVGTKSTYSDSLINMEIHNQDIADLTYPGTITHLISNPPYITSDEYKQLDKSVLNFEPKTALEAGSDGMSIYTLIARFLQKQTNKPQIYLEISPLVAQGVKNLFSTVYPQVEVKKDLFGRERFLLAHT